MTSPNIEIGFGIAEGTESYSIGLEAARRALATIIEHPISAVLVFASVRYDLEEVLKGIRYATRSANVLGTTTAGEICNGSRQGSVLVVILASPYIKVCVGVGQKVTLSWEKAVMEAIGTPELKAYFSPESTTTHHKLTIEGKQAFGLLFSPGNTRYADSRSFEILERLKRLSENRLPIFGGSAADDWRMDVNFVLHGQKAYPDSLLVAVFETSLEYGTAFYHGFVPGSEQATVTRVEGHELKELDGQPAAEVYARFFGKSVEELIGQHLTLTTGRPLGIPDHFGQYGINVASFITPDGGIRLSQPVTHGSTVTFMRPDMESLVSAGKEALRKALLRGNVKNPALILAFSCALRQKILGERSGEEISNMMQLAPGVPVVGFYSFGEQGLCDDGTNRHSNDVITTLVIGHELSYAARVARENVSLQKQLQQTVANLKKRQEVILQSQEVLRTIIEAVPVGLWILDQEGHIIQGNSEARRIWGGTRRVGIEQYEEFKGWWVATGERIQSEHWAAARAIRKGETSLNEEVQIESFDGVRRIILNSAIPIRNALGEIAGAVVVNQDITEIKDAQIVLAQEKLFSDTVIQSLPGIFYSFDADGKIHRWNDRLLEVSGYSVEEIARMTPLDFIAEEDRSRAARLSHEIFARGEFSFEGSLKSKEGLKTPYYFTGSRMTVGDKQYLCGLGIDMSAYKRMESRLAVQRDLAVLLSSTSDLTFALGQVLDEITRLQSFDCGGIYLLDESSGDMILAVHSGLSPEVVEVARHLPADSPQTHLLMQGQVICSPYSDALSDQKDHIRLREGLKSIAIVPVQHHGRVIAAINAASHTRDATSKDDLHFLETIAAQIGGALYRLK